MKKDKKETSIWDDIISWMDDNLWKESKEQDSLYVSLVIATILIIIYLLIK